MTPIKIELVTADDIEILVKWLTESTDNLLDRDVYFYPNVQVLKAVTDHSIAFLPAQLTITLDSPAINPQASKLQIASSLRKLILHIRSQALDRGVREINFFTASDEMAEFAKAHGFEEIPHRLFRLKLQNPSPGIVEDSHVLSAK